MPKTNKIFFKLEDCQYDTSFDLNMGYYHIQLTEDASNLCKIIIPWGKYQYRELPMILSRSSDIFQNIMNKMFQGFENICAFIDGFLILTKRDW